jgi:hypothetical protein
MTEQLFAHVGISTRFGTTRVRFTNNATRSIILIKDGHDDITFFELPKPMTKSGAVTYILGRKEEFESLEDRMAIDEAQDRYNTVIVARSKAKVKAPSIKDLKTRTVKSKATAKA